MKTVFYFSTLLVCLSLFVACNKEESTTPQNDPDNKELYFQFLIQDGSLFENNEVKIGLVQSKEDGEITYSTENPELSNLGRVNTFDNEMVLFGPECPNDNCPESEYIALVYGQGWENDEVKEDDSWTNERQYVLQYPNEEFDTLKIIDILQSNFERTFELYINGELKEVKDIFDDSDTRTYITIQK
ncbi:hypothetical protein [Marixanthomonas ophiurae]|uniref:Uncharacterized protein n=1 Tax=Marixanthomonas ophiurae TaxID=387659 RepID=A0A3E1QAU5_9FLAO|nr:hypothetical protein [Marixanthomonas ophiurae]RFN59255.1 hypothetical protein DZ858_04065 [Marixanthomonas ophiurae]